MNTTPNSAVSYSIEPPRKLSHAEEIQQLIDRPGIGNEECHHRGMSFYYTEGVLDLANAAGAHWLIDAIFSWQIDRHVRNEEFQVWTLKAAINRPRHYLLICEDGGKDGHESQRLATQEIEYSDFPLDHVELYVELGSVDGKHSAQILMLPSER